MHPFVASPALETVKIVIFSHVTRRPIKQIHTVNAQLGTLLVYENSKSLL